MSAQSLGAVSSSDLAQEVINRINGSKRVDADAVGTIIAESLALGGNPAGVSVAGIFGPRPDGSRPILDALAGIINDPAFKAMLLKLILGMFGGAGASHSAPANPVE